MVTARVLVEQSGKRSDTSLTKTDLVFIKERNYSSARGEARLLFSVAIGIHISIWEMMAPQRRLEGRNGSS